MSSAKHKQVKVQVDAGVANAFKAACAKAGVSMAGELSHFMAEYGSVAKKRSPAAEADVTTRRNRRRRVSAMIAQMERVRDAEMRYYDNFPENLQSSAAYESTEESISVMDEVIDLLEAVYE